jgi:hypothetical protein
MPDDKKGRVKINPKIVEEHKREQKEGYKGTVEDYYEEFYGPVDLGLKKGGSIKKLKVKKAFLGLAAEAVKKSPMSLIGIGADKLLKNSSTARDIASNLGIGGDQLAKYYNKKANSNTDQKSTEQVVAKKQGGMIRGTGAAIRGTKFKGIF